jgi:hypothetical protein
MSALLFLALPASRNEKTLDRLCSGSIADDGTTEPLISLSLYDAHASFTDIVPCCSPSGILPSPTTPTVETASMESPLSSPARWR